MSLIFSGGSNAFSTQVYIGVMPFLSVSLSFLSRYFGLLIIPLPWTQNDDWKALYPALVMLIVSLEKSRDELNSVNDMSLLSQSLRFAGIAAASHNTTETQGESWQEQATEAERSWLFSKKTRMLFKSLNVLISMPTLPNFAFVAIKQYDKRAS
jgi:hypothetical protein